MKMSIPFLFAEEYEFLFHCPHYTQYPDHFLASFFISIKSNRSKIEQIM